MNAWSSPRWLAVVVVAVSSLVVSTVAPAQSHSGHGSHGAGFSPLVEKVRLATARYLDVNVAIGEHWMPATPCVSGPDAGAMGVHFLLPSRLDGALKGDEPEALIYEPLPNGSLRLVGVEFIVLAADWAAGHPDG